MLLKCTCDAACYVCYVWQLNHVHLLTVRAYKKLSSIVYSTSFGVICTCKLCSVCMTVSLPCHACRHSTSQLMWAFHLADLVVRGTLWTKFTMTIPIESQVRALLFHRLHNINCINVFTNGIQTMSRAPLTRLSIHKIWKQKYIVNFSALRYNVAYTTLTYCPAYEDKQSWTMYLLCHTP